MATNLIAVLPYTVVFCLFINHNLQLHVSYSSVDEWGDAFDLQNQQKYEALQQIPRICNVVVPCMYVVHIQAIHYGANKRPF